LRLYRQHADQPSCTGTIVNASWRYKEKDIDKIRFEKIGRQIATQLKRAGVTAASGILVGAFDADFDGEYLQIHIHFIAIGNKVEKLDKLREMTCYKSSEVVHKPIVCKPIKDPRRQFSYCFKSHWRSNAYYFDKDGSRVKSSQRRRLPRDVEALCLQKLHETRLCDLLILNGVRLGKSGLTPSFRLSSKVGKKDNKTNKTTAKNNANVETQRN
jgi:hypothetical protein